MAIQDKFVVMSLGVYQQELAVVFRGVCFFVCLPVFFRDEGKVIEFSYERPFQIWPMKYTVSSKSFNQLEFNFIGS